MLKAFMLMTNDKSRQYVAFQESDIEEIILDVSALNSSSLPVYKITLKNGKIYECRHTAPDIERMLNRSIMDRIADEIRSEVKKNLS